MLMRYLSHIPTMSEERLMMISQKVDSGPMMTK